IAQPTAAADWMPATIDAAPNRMNTPMITVAPKRQFIRPVSMPKPIAATAMTATAVATVPSSVPCIQASAATIGPDPAGSTPCACAAAGTNRAATAVRRDSRRILFGTPGIVRQTPHDRGDIELGFANARDAARVDHAAGAGVVGGEGLLEVTVET